MEHKQILIRLIYENKTHKTSIEKIIYEYLSAIIHKSSYLDIVTYLDATSFSEEDILLMYLKDI